MNERRLHRNLTRVIWSIYGSISLIYIFAGSLHLDEGAYLYASHAVYQGQLPYRDFFFLQPPLHPYIYGLIQTIIPGLLMARLTSVLFGILSTLMLMRLARRLSDRAGSLVFLAMMTMMPFQLYFFTITRLYSLTAFFIAAGTLAVFSNPNPHLKANLLGMTAFALAVATRLTTAPLFCIVSLTIMLRGNSLKTRFLPVFAGIAVLAGIYWPFISAAGFEQFWFNVMGMNLSLHTNNPEANLIQKARATAQLIRYYFPLWIMAIPLLIQFIRKIKPSLPGFSISSWIDPRRVLWLMTITMILVHSSAKLYQVSYQTIIMPLMICLIAAEWRNLYVRINPVSKRLYRGFFLALWVMGLLAYGRTSISIISGKPAMFALWEQAAFVREQTAPGDKIFTADSALVAAESGREIIEGMAGSDLFAGWDTEKCRKYKVLNFDIMTGHVKNHTGALLMMGDLSFHLSLPFLEPVPELPRKKFRNLIEKEYEQIAKFPNLMLPGTNSTYYRPRKEILAAPDRMLLFGIDAVGWDVLEPLIREGFLPNIQHAIENGVPARMKTLEPTVSVMLWTTIATGMMPEKHGIDNWLMESADSSGQQAITSDKRTVAAFWNLFEDRTVNVVNWWATWPVEQINGIMISNRAHFPGIEHSVFPPERADLLNTTPLVPVVDLERELSNLNPSGTAIQLPPFFGQQLQKDRYYLDLAEKTLEDDSVGVLAVFVRGIDILQHEFLRDVRPDAENIPEVPEKQKGIVKAYYRYLDQWLGKFLDKMGPETGVILVSDHGMDPVETLPPLVEGLSIDKLLESLAKQDRDLDLLVNFKDNRLYPPGLLRGIRWVGDGPIPVEIITKLHQILKSLKVNNQEELFTHVSIDSRTSEVIRLTLNPNPLSDALITGESVSIPIMSVTDMILHPRSGQHWHSPDGIFLISGPGIRISDKMTTIRIVDIMPTFLRWLSIPISRELDGVPKTDFFTEELQGSVPIQWVESYKMKTSHQTIVIPEEVDKELRRELESLGYIHIGQP